MVLTINNTRQEIQYTAQVEVNIDYPEYDVMLREVTLLLFREN